jgi:uncharacterized protein YjbI with pentapeptide repeats
VTELHADCARCFGLCCVALPFVRSREFAISKPAGTPCGHLRADFRCTVHDDLPGAGFGGCAVYECFGAGQRVAQQMFGGRDWRTQPELAVPMFAAFRTMRHLHELLWYLRAALSWVAAAPVHDQLRAARSRVDTATDTLEGLDVNALRADIAPLLRRASELMRGADAPDRSDADLSGRDLRGTELRRTSLRNARLIAADLRGADLAYADLLGTDLRDADVRGADLSAALYLTQPQLNAARGDDNTRIPTGLDRPPRWARTSAG